MSPGVPAYRPEHEVAYGLDGVDLRLAAFLPRDAGTFAEAGANDGLAQSNTALLESHRGWRGLLVEAHPALAAACRRNRPAAIVEQAALVAPDHAGATIALHDAQPMSVVAGARGSAAADRAHVEDGLRRQGLSGTATFEVPAATLSALLDRHALAKVDLLSLDVEGFEAPALRGLDLDRHAPRWILVEVWDRPAVDALLAPRYDAVARLSQRDVLYRRRPTHA